MPRKKTKHYKLPPAVGHYRKGVFYEPGSIIEIPVSEKPGRKWREVRVNTPRPEVEEIEPEQESTGPSTMSEAATARRTGPPGT